VVVDAKNAIVMKAVNVNAIAKIATLVKTAIVKIATVMKTAIVKNAAVKTVNVN
jgi:hypothetical protein